jgi:tetratricopeptide (TPR) repeat protein
LPNHSLRGLTLLIRTGQDTRHATWAYLLAAASLVGSGSLAASLASGTSDNDLDAKGFEAAIAALDKADPRSPAALNSRLDYADFLAGATGSDCQSRLDNAQSQLDGVAGNPTVDIVLPFGRARTANIEYRLHLARASCASDPAKRENELRESLAAAQRAVDLYRDALDYQSMVIMQFDVGATHRMLGNDTAALAALQSAIDMDQEYGFWQDADENSKVLMRWKKTPGIAPVIKRLPTRAAVLKFGWAASDATVAADINYGRVVDGKIVRSKGTRMLRRHVRADRGGWTVSYEPQTAAYDIDGWPAEIEDLFKLAICFTHGLLQFPDVEVSSNGDFRKIVDTQQFAAQLFAETKALILGHMPGSNATPNLPPYVASAVSIAFSPQVVDSMAAEDHNLDTAAWIGATLEQGVWYTMSANLSIPGISQFVAHHDLEFAYTHDVPCTPKSSARSCIEIVVHAIPDEDAVEAKLEHAMHAINPKHDEATHYWSATYLRIVTDPNTLTTYVRDVRRYWYISFSDADPDAVENESERVVSTFSY